MRRFAFVWISLVVAACGQREIRASPEALNDAPPELLEKLRTDPYNYFRFVNHEWTSRVCEMFAADQSRQPSVQLHGDAHIEQYAFTSDAWGLDDFDDSTRGPALVDIVRFLGSIDLALRRRGWEREREHVIDTFFDGYRRGLSDPFARPGRPAIVDRLELQASTPTNEAFLAWAESRMAPMSDASMRSVIVGMSEFAILIQLKQPELPDAYFRVLRAGWLRMGIGSASNNKVLLRVEGASSRPDDDVVLEAKVVRALDGLECLEMPTSRPTFRVIAGSQQLGRLKHSILVGGPEGTVADVTIRGQQLRNWWIRSWEPSYREIGLDDVDSVEELSALVYDAGVQLGAGSIHQPTGGVDTSLQEKSLAMISALEPRLRSAAEGLVKELLQGWQTFRTAQ